MQYEKFLFVMILVFSSACTSQELVKRVEQLEQESANKSQTIKKLEDSLAKTKKSLKETENLLEEVNEKNSKEKEIEDTLKYELKGNQEPFSDEKFPDNSSETGVGFKIIGLKNEGKLSGKERISTGLPVAEPKIGPITDPSYEKFFEGLLKEVHRSDDEWYSDLLTSPSSRKAPIIDSQEYSLEPLEAEIEKWELPRYPRTGR